MKGKDGTTSFLPIESKTGGKVSYIKNREAICLSEKQTNYVYKKVEEGGIINVNAMKHEVEQDLDREDDNPYKRVILNKVYKDEDKTPQMENWSIFTDKIKYIQYDEKTPHRLDLNTNYIKNFIVNVKREEGDTLDIDFGANHETLKTNYLDLYEDTHAEMVYTNRFDENSDLSTTYLGQTKVTRDTKIRAEEKFPLPEKVYLWKIIGWNWLSNFVRYRCHKVLHVKILLFEM